MQKVADLAGVSITTVSHVLNRSRFVEPNLRQSVLDCAESIGYTKKHTIQRSHQPDCHIGLVISDIKDSALFIDVIKTCESMAREYGYSILIADAENSAEQELELVGDFLRKRVCGLLIASNHKNSLRMRKLAGFGDIPTVLIDRSWQDSALDFVGIDNFRAAFEATQQHIAKGARRLGFIAGGHSGSTVEQRLEGYKMAVVHAGLQQDFAVLKLDLLEDLQSQIVQFCYGDGKPRFDTLFCFNSHICYDLLSALQNAGKELAGFSYITFDDLPLLKFLPIAATVIRQPVAEISISAVELLMAKIRQREERGKDGNLGRQILHPYQIVQYSL